MIDINIMLLSFIMDSFGNVTDLHNDALENGKCHFGHEELNCLLMASAL